MSRSSAVWPALVLLPLTAACGGGGSSTGGDVPAELPLLALSETPTLEIGLVAGDEDYLFQDVVSTARMESGEIVVADAGDAEIAVYSPEGVFLRRFGGQGGGPGELGSLSRIYPRDGLILALDIRNDRYSVFDVDGTFLENRPDEALSSDSLFRADVWLHGRYWVDGATEDARRDRVRAVLNRLPPPVSSPGLRYVKVADDGRLWIREEERAADGTRAWTIVDADAVPTAAIRIPARFQPQRIHGDEVLGRWLGESDVHIVRAYDLVDGSGTLATPGWLRSDGAAAAEAADEEEVRDLVRQAIRQMASAQEIHYASNYSYTTDASSLERWEPPEGIEVTFMTGDRRGWSAAFTHPGFDRVCALGYGASMPPGWTPGMIICAPPAQPQMER